MSESAIRYAVAGLGRAGWGIHVHQLRSRDDAKIVAVVDPVEARRAEAVAEFQCRGYTSLAKMLKQENVEVVVVATPSTEHGRDTIKSLRAGKHVVVEKPMALTLSQADSMIATARETGRQLFVHQNYRFYQEFLHLKRTIDSGRIGRVYHIRQYVSSFLRRNDWQTLSKNGGGVLNNTMIHFLDQALQLLPGKVADVWGDLQQIASAGDVEDHAKAILRTDAGATADLEISTAQNVAIPLPKWIIAGTTGTITHDGKRMTVRWYDPSQVQPLEVRDGPAAERRYGNDDQLPWQEETIESNDRAHGAFYDDVAAVVRAGRPMTVTPESVRETMRVLFAIRKAAKKVTKTQPRSMGISPTTL